MPLWHCMPLLLSRQFHIISHHFTNCELLQYFLLVEYRGNPLGWAYHSPPFPWCHLSDWEEGHSISSSETRWPSWLRCSCMSCEVASWCILICINMYHVLTCGMQNYAKIIQPSRVDSLERCAELLNTRTVPQVHLPLLSPCPLFPFVGDEPHKVFKWVQTSSTQVFRPFQRFFTMFDNASQPRPSLIRRMACMASRGMVCETSEQQQNRVSVRSSNSNCSVTVQ